MEWCEIRLEGHTYVTTYATPAICKADDLCRRLSNDISLIDNPVSCFVRLSREEERRLHERSDKAEELLSYLRLEWEKEQAEDAEAELVAAAAALNPCSS